MPRPHPGPVKVESLGRNSTGVFVSVQVPSLGHHTSARHLSAPQLTSSISFKVPPGLETLFLKQLMNLLPPILSVLFTHLAEHLFMDGSKVKFK